MIPQAELAADHVVSAELARLLGRIEQMDGDLVAAPPRTVEGGRGVPAHR